MYDTPAYLRTPPVGVVRKGQMPSQPSYGALQHTPAYGSAGKAALLGVGVVSVIGLFLLPSLVLYPWVIKKFKPKWSYGKRVGAGLAIGVGTSLVRSALTPESVKLAREEARIEAAANRRERKDARNRQIIQSTYRNAGLPVPATYSGWAPRTWFGGGWKADLEEQQGWAEAQLALAKSGSALTSIYGPGCCTTGGGDVTASSFTQSPTNVNGMHTRSAYWLALTARAAMGAGWSQDAVQALIKEADDTLVASSKSYLDPEDPALIRAGFQFDIDLITKLGAQNPPLPDYKTILQRLANMGDLASIDFAQEQDVSVVSGTVTGILADIRAKAGLGGEGGAVVRAEEAQAAEDEQRRQNMKPFWIAGGIALTLGVGYVFLKKD